MQYEQLIRNDSEMQHGGGSNAEREDLDTRIRVAADVKLLGKMSGTGFATEPWLIGRGQTFIQVTELLYRVLEQIDRHPTFDAIAEHLSKTTEWLITGEQVRYLVEAKLAPIGLVTSASKTAEQPSASRPGALSVYMKMRTIGPGLINPVAGALRFLFYPPVLVGMLLTILGAHWWLYRIHGAGRSLDATLGTPGGLLLILGIVLAAGCFHELGHAAALKYGGGHVRGMGVGLYLLYPAFYTDVTDGYRLNRVARVRTDLGGVYFHAIACVVLMALSIWWKAELLLFAVVLINIEIVRQFIPFVKLDGYWLLADLTGIPDFFSQMKPFLLSAGPKRWRRAGTLPVFKPWVKAVFTLYIVTVVPVLTYLLFLMVKHLPAMAERTGTAIISQFSALPLLLRNGDMLTFVLLCFTITLLTLSLIGMFFVVLATLVPPIFAIWKWTHGIGYRVSVAAAATALLLGCVSFLWYPDATRLYTRLTAPSASQRASQLLDRAARQTRSLTSLQADVVGALGQDLFTGTIAVNRPNFAKLDIHSNGSLGDIQLVSDGSELHTFFPADKKVVDVRAGQKGEYINTYMVDQVDQFFRPESVNSNLGQKNVTYAGTLVLDGVACDLVDQRTQGANVTVTQFAIGQADGLIHSVTVTRPNGQNIRWARLKNMRVNENVNTSEFAWRAPKDASPASLPPGFSLPTVMNK